MLLKKQKLKNVYYSDHVREDGIAFYKNAEEIKSEGIIAKRVDNLYRLWKRTNQWLKIKIVEEEEVIIIGMTEPRNSRSYLGSLILVQYDGNNLRYIGKCGTGFDEASLKALCRSLLLTLQIKQ